MSLQLLRINCDVFVHRDRRRLLSVANYRLQYRSARTKRVINEDTILRIEMEALIDLGLQPGVELRHDSSAHLLDRVLECGLVPATTLEQVNPLPGFFPARSDVEREDPWII